MIDSTKRKTLIVFGVVVIITMLIAASLSQLELQPGMSLPRLQSGQVVAPPAQETPLVDISINKFVIGMIALLLAGALLYSIFERVKGASWKEIASVARLALLIGALISGFAFLIMLLPRSGDYSVVEIPPPTLETPVTSPLGSVPTPLLWLVGIGLLVVSVLVGVWILTSSSQKKPIEQIGAEAEKAWRALKTGGNLKDVIIQCYQQMSLALKKEQGIERNESMTTREFEQVLEAAGMPHQPIHQLTLLFEAVRYGHWQPGPSDEQAAIQCLEAIMVHSHKAGGKD